MRVLVIGAAGQLGYDISRVFSPDHEVLGADVDSSEAAIKVDITDPTSVDAMLVETRPEVVINCAAFTNVDGCEAQKEACWAVNAEGAGNIARACVAAGDAVTGNHIALVQISTDYVFDGKAHEAYKEDDQTSPLGAYGKSKFAGEQEVREELDRHLIARTAWLFGSHGQNFVKTMLELGHKRRDIKVVNDQTGSPTYAGHLAVALKALIETRLDNPGTYHMVGGGHCTWYEFASEIFRLSGLEVNVKRTTTEAYGAPAPRPAYSVLANTRAPEIVMPHWRDGLIECLRELGELNEEKLCNFS
jgi:dTDP-4-dehydrorhamnose reductase